MQPYYVFKIREEKHTNMKLFIYVLVHSILKWAPFWEALYTRCKRLHLLLTTASQSLHLDVYGKKDLRNILADGRYICTVGSVYLVQPYYIERPACAHT